MHYAKRLVFLVVSFTLLALTGCGGGSNSSSGNPFSNNPTSTTTGGGGDIFGNISTATGKTGIALTTDRTTVDVNNGQVLVTAKLVKDGTAVSGVPVTFSILAPVNGPATIDPNLTTVNTDSNGVAVTRITAGNNLVTTNVIVQATGTISGQTATATTSFQIVRGNGVIMFTSAAGLTPGSQTNMLDPFNFVVDPAVTPKVSVVQLIPFKVTDSNGNPRVGVPVTLSVYSIIGDQNSVTIDYLVPPVTETTLKTITTDSAGMGIYNVSVNIASPPPGSFTTSTVVFKAVTNDSIPVTAYVGRVYSLTSTIPTLVITPTTGSFGAATDINFTISGGSAPYKVTSSDPNLVSVSVTGSTVTAHLVNNAAWAQTVTITVTDSAGQVQSSSITR